MFLFRHTGLRLFLLLFCIQSAYADKKTDSLYTQAQASFQKGDYATAMKLDIEALRVAESLGDCNLEATAQTTIAALHYHLQQKQEALTWFRKAIVLAERCNNDTVLARATMNSGSIHLETGKIDSAIYLLQRADTMIQQKPAMFAVSRRYDILATLYCVLSEGWYSGKKDKQKGWYYLGLAEKNALLSGKKDRIGFAIIKKGMFLTHEGRCREGESYFRKTLNIYQDDPEGKMYAMQLTAWALSECGDAKGAYDMMNKLRAVRDSIFKTQTAQAVATTVRFTKRRKKKRRTAYWQKRTSYRPSL